MSDAKVRETRWDWRVPSYRDGEWQRGAAWSEFSQAESAAEIFFNSRSPDYPDEIVVETRPSGSETVTRWEVDVESRPVFNARKARRS